MRKVCYVKFNDSGIGPIARAAFPDNRKDVAVGEFMGPMNVNSYWDGGSRDEYRIVDLATLKVWSVPTSHPYFDKLPNGSAVGQLQLSELPPGTALASGGFFCGKPATVRVHLRPENIAGLIAAPAVLDAKEKSALNIIAGMKSGYRQDEFNRSGLGKYSPLNPVVQALASKGLVKITATGVSVTTEGRNARN